VGKPIGKHPQVRPRNRWGDIIKVGVGEIGGDDGRCLEVAEDRLRWQVLPKLGRSTLP